MVIDRSHLLVVLALIGFAILLWLQDAHFQDEIKGQVKVIDGDSLTLDGERIRLKGIDAPEGRQFCRKDGKNWACGRAATRALRQFIADAPVECRGNEFDRHGRLLGICYVAGKEINRWMIEQGWAVSFGGVFNAAERQARQTKQGIWQSEFELPHIWRRQNSRF